MYNEWSLWYNEVCVFFEKNSSNIFQVDNFCIFVPSLAGKSLATDGWVTDIYLRRLLTLCFGVFIISQILNLSRNNSNGRCLRLMDMVYN